MGVRCNAPSEHSEQSSPRSTVTVIRGDRLVRVATEDRPQDPAARETRNEDRPTIDRVHDKLFKTYKEHYVHKVLRSYAQDDQGLLTGEQLRAALDRLHLGLGQREKDRLVARVAPVQHGKIHYMDFLRSLEIPQPLGGEAQAVARGTCLPGPPTVRPGGGGNGIRDGGPSFWNWKRHRSEKVPGLLDEVREGTFEQAQSDALLTNLMSTKLSQYQDKLRIIFRQMDANRNSEIDREEFVKGIAKLRLNVPRAQAERLFDLCDTDRNGHIDYEEFVTRFEDRGLTAATQAAEKARLRAAGGVTTLGSSPAGGGGAGAGGSGQAPLAQTMGLSADEVESALRHPLVHQLARNLYAKGPGAHSVFVRQDMTRSGCLDVGGMTKCCQALAPGIGERQVAAVMAALDPGSAGHVDYRAFVSRLMERDVANPRLLHSAPAGSEGGGMGDGSFRNPGFLTFSGGPLTVPEALPTAHSRSLSAVGMSRSDRERGRDGAADGAAGLGLQALPRRAGTAAAGSQTYRERSGLDDLHDEAIAPFLDSISRVGGGGFGADGDGASTAGPAGLPTVARSVDIGTLNRSGQALLEAPPKPKYRPVGGRTDAAASSHAPTHATGRFSRFWDKRYASTSYITSVDPASASYCPIEGTWVRKDDKDDFHVYQGDDRSTRQRRRDQAQQRFQARSEVDAGYSAQDDANDGRLAGRLEVAAAAQQRHEERCEMYDRIRQMEGDRNSNTIFGRLPNFAEHQLESHNPYPLRSYW
ncbi:hypothetical protein HYH03_005318 [Edaphochlamys debaryana]|uniref:EF-hand domain-containing protein n=1 Tax=Edaphochlamys debaryana TaxID=47281 RepID=A0A835Y824_9CHLO|nr:hypothetical protein HYH03_005318 [Edaphochlamys debaryana]|eukprot:KAG2496493.1 hypothetical protein HYH03_005318 [Edaphochlamys debaryana]